MIADNLSSERIVAMLAVSFGVLAVLLAAIGLYGVLAYSTAQRTREIGIRMALGAARSSVVKMVIADVLWLAVISVVITIPLSLLLSGMIRSQLYNISSYDPLSLALGVDHGDAGCIVCSAPPGSEGRVRRSHEGASHRIITARRS